MPGPTKAQFDELRESFQELKEKHYEFRDAQRDLQAERQTQLELMKRDLKDLRPLREEVAEIAKTVDRLVLKMAMISMAAGGVFGFITAVATAWFLVKMGLK